MTTIEIAALAFGMLAGGTALGMFVMAAMMAAVDRSDEDE